MKTFDAKQSTESLLKELKAFLDSLNIRGYSIGAHTAVIFFYSPVSEFIEERHMWASDANECNAWLNQCTAAYTELNFNYAAYLDEAIQTVNWSVVSNDANAYTTIFKYL